MADSGILEVAVVSAERLLWQGEAKSVVAKTPEGEIGILPGHEPVLSLLVESPLRIEETGWFQDAGRRPRRLLLGGLQQGERHRGNRRTR